MASDSAQRVSGAFERGPSEVQFLARTQSPVAADVEVVVNGTRVTASRDLKTGLAVWSAAGQTLMPDDHAVLVAFNEAVSQRWLARQQEQRQGVGNHRDLVLRTAMLLAEAPVGVRLTEQTVPRPQARQLDKYVADLGGPRVESCMADVVATTAAGSDTRRAGVAACQEANEDGILYFGDCDTYGRWICHDADSHCFLCESISAGPASSGCLGECGPDCNGLNIYSYDCGDHDQCGRVHGGSLNPWDSECGDEYFEADDDFLWGWPNC